MVESLSYWILGLLLVFLDHLLGRLFFFHSDIVMSLLLRCVSCMQQNAGSCLHIQSVSLCLFIGEFSPLILIDFKERWLWVPDMFVFVGGCMCLWFSAFGFVWRWLINILSLVHVPTLCWNFPSRILYRAGLVDRYVRIWLYSGIFWFLHLCWLRVLLGIVTWADICVLYQNNNLIYNRRKI